MNLSTASVYGSKKSDPFTKLTETNIYRNRVPE